MLSDSKFLELQDFWVGIPLISGPRPRSVHGSSISVQINVATSVKEVMRDKTEQMSAYSWHS